MKNEVKTDCFAYYDRGMNGKPIKEPVCSCLYDMACADGKCSFYKPKRVFLKQLIDIHGTTDMRKIKESYAIRRGIVADA